MYRFVAIDWISLGVALLLVALLVQAYRKAPAGRAGLAIKVASGLLLALIGGLLAWNTVSVALLR
jgi:hypothetical protein